MDNHIVKNLSFAVFYRWGQLILLIGLVSFPFSLLALTSHDEPKTALQKQSDFSETQITINELHATQNRISELEARVKALQSENSALKADMKTLNAKKSDGMSFEVWTGILLACAALLLTILGIGIALLSVFGYRKIVKSSSESAQRIAVKVAEDISVATANQATSAELQRLIKMGAFNAVIREAIETISYRGLQPLSELDDQEP